MDLLEYYVNVTQTVKDISPLMAMHQDPLLVWTIYRNPFLWWIPLLNLLSLDSSWFGGLVALSYLNRHHQAKEPCRQQDRQTQMALATPPGVVKAPPASAPREPYLHTMSPHTSSLSLWIWKSFKLIEAEWPIYASVNDPSLVQTMAWRLAGAKPLSEPILEYC